MSEKGSISKQSIFTLGTLVGSAAISSILSAKKTEATAAITLGSNEAAGQITVTASHTHHASHSSHGSHGSHGSHSSHGAHGSHGSHASYVDCHV